MNVSNFELDITSKEQANAQVDENSKHNLLVVVGRIEWMLANPDRTRSQSIRVNASEVDAETVEQIKKMYREKGWQTSSAGTTNRLIILN